MLLVASRNSLGCAAARDARSPKHPSFISSDNYRILTLDLASCFRSSGSLLFETTAAA